MAELRTLLDRRWPGTTSACVAVGLAPTDVAAGLVPADLTTGFRSLLSPGGGIPAGRLTEIFGSSSSGKTTLAFAILATITRTGNLAAYVDPGGGFFAPAAAGAGVDLRRLLVVRPRDARAARRAVDALVRGGACAVVAFDCGGLPNALAAHHCTRLVAQAEKTGTRLVIVSRGDASAVASFAALRLRASGLVPLWQDGSGGGQLLGCSLSVEVIKARTLALGCSAALDALLPDVAGRWPNNDNVTAGLAPAEAVGLASAGTRPAAT